MGITVFFKNKECAPIIEAFYVIHLLKLFDKTYTIIRKTLSFNPISILPH